MTVLTANVELSRMKLMREWHRLLGSITDICYGVSNSEEYDEEDAEHGRTYDRSTNLHSHVEPA
jgi:hypothetical protein